LAPVSGGGVESPANHLREARFCGAHRNRGGGSAAMADQKPVRMACLRSR
jgi:hypothetical protein